MSHSRKYRCLPYLCMLLCAAFNLLPFAAHAQTPAPHAFYDEVATIKKYDKQYQFPAHPVLFVGSSSIRKWDGLQVAFGAYNVLNRGIGGAVINDITYYLDDIVFPYKPRQIVLYVGENDLPDNNATADTILNRTVRLFTAIRAGLPGVPIAYISMKPSPVRDQYQQKAKDANRLIQAFVARQQQAVFVDIFPQMIQDGHSRPELFGPDRLHMNAAGYAIWQKALKPFLLR